MIGWLRKRRLARRADELMPGQGEFENLCRGHPCLDALDDNERLRLRRLTAMILASKEFHGAGGLEPGWDQCLVVAVHAALPVLEVGLDVYRQFRTFILYRDEFEAEFEDTDEAGVVHHGRDLRAGEAWHRGPVVLSLADVEQSGRGDGYHVVVHELAHQFDQLTGEADGCPPLSANISRRDWADTFNNAYHQLEEQVRTGTEPDMDPYAAESPAEYFAVSSEYFFDCPERLAAMQPDVYHLLKSLYRQDPLARSRIK